MSYDKNRWYKKSPKPDFLKRKFARWYSHIIVTKYKATFGHFSLGLQSEKKEEKLAREFGWVYKDYKHAPNSLSHVSDELLPPLNEDEWGNKLDKEHW